MFDEKKKPHQSPAARLLPAAASDPAPELADENFAPFLVFPSSCKLLNSHLSIYDALTNPELDINIPLPPLAAVESFATPPPPQNFPLVVPIPLDNSCASFLSWQSVNFPSEPPQDSFKLWRRASPGSPSLMLTTSILSSTDDNPSDAASRPVSESMVLLPSVEKAIMVFETDEEDGDDDDDDEDDDAGLSTHIIASSPQFGDDDKTLTSGTLRPKHVSVAQNQLTSFIMPRMSLSETGSSYRLTVLSSSNEMFRLEASALINYIRRSVEPGIVQKLHISHLVLAQPPFDFDLAAVRSSDLLFLVNDGSWVFSQFLANLVEPAHEHYPKLTIFNIMTSNYFVNLLEIINLVTPHQILKALSLTSDATLLKVKIYLDSELSDHSHVTYNREYETQKQRFNKHKPRSSKNTQPMYSSLVPTKKVDYRRMERQICAELLMSLSYHDVDPLNLSSSLGHMKTLFDGVVKFFSSSHKPDLTSDRNPFRENYLYFVCSFSIGIGVGVVVATGAVAALSSGVFSKLLLRPPEQAQQLVAVVEKSGPAAYISDTLHSLDRGVDYLASCARVCVSQVMGRSKPAVKESVLMLDTMVGDMTLFGTFLVRCAWGGLTKATGLLLG